MSEAIKSLNAVWNETKSLKNESLKLKEQCDNTAKENYKLNKEITTLKDRIIKQENYSQRENFRFYNIPENPGESGVECSRKVMDVLNELRAEPENLMFHAIHRIGNPNKTTASSTSAADSEDRTATREEGSCPVRPRPVIVRFVSRMDSDWVFNNRRRLRDSSLFSSVFIDKDLSAESAKERGKLRAAFKKAKELNIARVFLKGKKLVVNSSSYTADNIPEYLLPQRNVSD